MLRCSSGQHSSTYTPDCLPAYPPDRNVPLAEVFLAQAADHNAFAGCVDKSYILPFARNNDTDMAGFFLLPVRPFKEDQVALFCFLRTDPFPALRLVCRRTRQAYPEMPEAISGEARTVKSFWGIATPFIGRIQLLAGKANQAVHLLFAQFVCTGDRFLRSLPVPAAGNKRQAQRQQDSKKGSTGSVHKLRKNILYAQKHKIHLLKRGRSGIRVLFPGNVQEHDKSILFVRQGNAVLYPYRVRR